VPVQGRSFHTNDPWASCNAREAVYLVEDDRMSGMPWLRLQAAPCLPSVVMAPLQAFAVLVVAAVVQRRRSS
jgi:hypothetical protein